MLAKDFSFPRSQNRVQRLLIAVLNGRLTTRQGKSQIVLVARQAKLAHNSQRQRVDPLGSFAQGSALLSINGYRVLSRFVGMHSPNHRKFCCALSTLKDVPGLLFACRTDGSMAVCYAVHVPLLGD